MVYFFYVWDFFLIYNIRNYFYFVIKNNFVLNSNKFINIKSININIFIKIKNNKYIKKN